MKRGEKAKRTRSNQTQREDKPRGPNLAKDMHHHQQRWK